MFYPEGTYSEIGWVQHKDLESLSRILIRPSKIQIGLFRPIISLKRILEIQNVTLGYIPTTILLDQTLLIAQCHRDWFTE